MASIYSTLVIILINFSLAFCASWTYSGSHGPSYWKDSYPICGRKSQSPIDIKTGSVKKEDLGQIIFTGYDKQLTSDPKIQNNGHSVVVTPTDTMTISAGGLAGIRTLAQFHFHWGSTATKGSEHTVDGTAAPLEMHLVHYDASLEDIATAVNTTKGLAVLGIFFEESSSDNPALTGIVSKLASVVAHSTSSTMAKFKVDSLLPGSLEKFYRYEGSLTTPTCDESVEWTIFKEKVKISKKQLDAFRALKSSTGAKLVDNFRPTTPLNGRPVKATFDANSSGLTKPTLVLVALMAAVTIFMLHN